MRHRIFGLWWLESPQRPPIYFAVAFNPVSRKSAGFFFEPNKIGTIVTETKLCVNCKYMSPHGYLKCAHPNNQIISRVTGNTLLLVEYCSNQRSGEISGTCGITGKWHTPAPKRNTLLDTVKRMWSRP